MGLENQELFTAKDAEDAKEGKDLPRMCADERGLRVGSRPAVRERTARR
jgi:hypothetical protein